MVTLESISKCEEELTKRFQEKMVVNNDLDRMLVSFQANKKIPGFRWFKYKEGFSASLIHYLLAKTGVSEGRLLDPFAGAGTTLFVGSSSGLDTVGIELLPVGCEIIEARRKAINGDRRSLQAVVDNWLAVKPWVKAEPAFQFSHVRITDGAFPKENETGVSRFMTAVENEKVKAARGLLQFAAMCVLEEISYTRKDGQYLRWDTRSGRRGGTKPFNKGPILNFDDAIQSKLRQIHADLYDESPSLFPVSEQVGSIDVLRGSCLDHLPKLEEQSFDCIITSPPYCNRYDYTRTYALELALLGTDEVKLRELRQSMVSCTVENREKEGLEDLFGAKQHRLAKDAFDSQELINQVVQYLEQRKEEKLLNNNGIPRMVRNYFWEMSLVIFQCTRLLKPGAPFVMVNDNVRYEGADIPVDLIFSEIAEKAGLTVEKVWVLPIGKGNSSQQMGKHGRNELRKCVYIWRAPKVKRARKPTPQLVAQQ